jgi:hypothetical protein
MRALLLLISAALFFYLPVVELGFVSDDHGLITHPTTGIANQSLATIFEGDLWHFQESQSGYYRPLMMLSLLADHAIFGDWAGGYHLHSLLWHLVCMGMLFGVLRRPFGDGAATVATAIFGFHPLVIEQVCFISARNDSMALALGLTAVALTMPRNASSRRCLAASILAAAACLSKETGVLVLCLLPLMDWARQKRGGWHRYGALAAGAVGWLYIREMLGPGLLHSPPMNGAATIQAEKITVLSTFVGKIVWPFPLTDSIHIAYLGAPPLPAAAAAVFLLAFLAFAGGRWARMGVLFALVAIVPGLLAVASRFLIGERYLTLPLIGICFAIAAVLPRTTKPIWALAVVLPLAWGGHGRIQDWSTDLTLATSAHMAQPTPYTASWMGHELLQVGEFKQGLSLLDDATSGTPPTCDFAGEWLRAVRISESPAAGVEIGNLLWDRRCAAATGVRGEWAHSLLLNGDLETAMRIMSPPPAHCDSSLVIPFMTIAMLQGDNHSARRCAIDAGGETEEILREVNTLLKRFTPPEPASTVPNEE